MCQFFIHTFSCNQMIPIYYYMRWPKVLQGKMKWNFRMTSDRLQLKPHDQIFSVVSKYMEPKSTVKLQPILILTYHYSWLINDQSASISINLHHAIRRLLLRVACYKTCNIQLTYYRPTCTSKPHMTRASSLAAIWDNSCSPSKVKSSYYMIRPSLTKHLKRIKLNKSASFL